MQYNLSRLRKSRGMSQSDLARKLGITQSFLSAIENGKSPLPPEKEEKILEIFNLEDLSDYKNSSGEYKPLKEQGVEMTDSDLFNQLLQRFHQQAHSQEESHHHHHHHEKIEELEKQIARLFERNEKLMKRNDSLASSNDRLREDNDRLRSENDSLREQIFKLKMK